MHPRVILQSHVGTVEVRPAGDRYVVVPVADNPRKGTLATFGRPEDALRWCASRRSADGTLAFEDDATAPERETSEFMYGDTYYRADAR